MVEAYKDFKDWWNNKGSSGGEAFKASALAKGKSILNYSIIALSVILISGLLYVLFERFRKKHGDAEAKKHLIAKLEKERTKLNNDPATKGKYNSKISILTSKVETFI